MQMSLSLLIPLMLFTMIIHMIDTLGYTVRLNSVKTRNIALSISLFNTIMLFSRTANMFQAPLIGKLVGESIQINYDPIIEVRCVILASSLGTLLAVILIPTFLNIFKKLVVRLETTGSIPNLLIQSLNANIIKKIPKQGIKPKKKMIKKLRYKNIPKKIIIINIIITGIYTIGVLAAYYATIYVPEHKRLAIAASSGVINGVATILYALIMDPKVAIIMDEAYQGKRDYNDIKTLVIFLISSKLVGTLLGQVLIVPASKFVTLFF